MNFGTRDVILSHQPFDVHVRNGKLKLSNEGASLLAENTQCLNGQEVACLQVGLVGLN